MEESLGYCNRGEICERTADITSWRRGSEARSEVNPQGCGWLTEVGALGVMEDEVKGKASRLPDDVVIDRRGGAKDNGA